VWGTSAPKTETAGLWQFFPGARRFKFVCSKEGGATWRVVGHLRGRDVGVPFDFFGVLSALEIYRQPTGTRGGPAILKMYVRQPPTRRIVAAIPARELTSTFKGLRNIAQRSSPTTDNAVKSNNASFNPQIRSQQID
jgi:hypothetical protein